MSPVSKVRKRQPAAAAARPEVSSAQRSYRRYRLLLRAGQILMIVGVLLALEHAAAHLGAVGGGQPPLWIDVVAGWPMAVVLFLIGLMFAGRKQFPSR